MPMLLGVSRGRHYIYLNDVPLVGHIAFGIIDRCTNVLQIRPTTVCPYNRIYCSVDAGSFSRHRLSEYIVDGRHLIKWVKHVYEVKGGNVLEGLIDGTGEPSTHPQIAYIVKELKKFLPRVAMETRGQTLTKELIDRLAEAGLDRLNLSIDTLSTEKCRYLQGVPWCNIEYVIKLVEYVIKETPIDVHLTPLWIPGVNDEDMDRIIEWGLRVGVGKRFPPFGIQKYEVHRHGRKVPGAREVGWKEFRVFLEKLERKYGIPLYYKNLDFGIRGAKCYPMKFKEGDVVSLIVVSPGWLRKEVLAVDRDFEVVVTIVGVEWMQELLNRVVKAKIVESYDTICVAKVYS